MRLSTLLTRQSVTPSAESARTSSSQRISWSPRRPVSSEPPYLEARQPSRSALRRNPIGRLLPALLALAVGCTVTPACEYLVVAVDVPEDTKGETIINLCLTTNSEEVCHYAIAVSQGDGTRRAVLDVLEWTPNSNYSATIAHAVYTGAPDDPSGRTLWTSVGDISTPGRPNDTVDPAFGETREPEACAAIAIDASRDSVRQVEYPDD